ncbi:uncharacterized protein LOC108665350 [Hyalella azteca]|uniref:Uncharacterized protein LOC108665350 n=1 Tax=Hyalella azteca TaxID=294128 RepID=A0A8B7N2Y3_HYAAZ|nr:uncharacterized protein LOC108665350 [Hyalella azteca]
MAILAKIFMSVFGATITAAALARYDIVFYPSFKITPTKVYKTFNVSSLSECRRRCVDDPECTGWTEWPTRKSNLDNCQHTRDSQPGTTLVSGYGMETYFKEKKPKKYFWSSDVGYGSDKNFTTLCAQDNGQPGLVHTLQEYEYIRDNLMSAVTEWSGRFIPLMSYLYSNNTRKSNKWTGTQLQVDGNHVLHRHYDPSFDDLCNTITPTNDLTLKEYSCTETKLNVLCYTY